jgi:hypothetical protein
MVVAERRFMKFILLSALLSVVAGCGSSSRPAENDIGDPTVYASYVKSRVVRMLEGVRKDSTGGAKKVDSLVSTLEKYTLAPMGDNEATYRELLEACKGLQGLSDAALKKSTDKINRVISLAKTLPGDNIGFDG